MPPLIRVLLLAAGAAIIGVVVYHQFFQTTSDQAWDTLGVAAQTRSISALEAAHDQITSGPARPWVEYELAIQLYDAGGADNFERSLQIAQAAVAAHPDHVTTPWLRRLIAAVGTYGPAGAAN